MPGKSGVELLPELRASYPDTAVIMATAIEAMSDETACAELEHCKGTQFDPEVADAFLRSRRSTSSVV